MSSAPAQTNPRVSVILPTFNRAHLLPRAIRSVQSQTFTDWELLVIDDGSTDTTSSFVNEVMRLDKRIRYFYHTNRGLAVSRNAGAHVSTGEFLTFLDSDDEYLPRHLALRINFMDAHPDVHLVHSDVEVVGDEFVSDKRDPSKKISVHECIIGGTFFLRKEVMAVVGGFTDQYSDDSDFFDRARQKFRTEKITAPTYRYYRTESDSLCAIVEREGIEGLNKFRHEHE